MKTRAKISAFLKEAMGLDVATVGPTALDHAVRSRMADCGIQEEESYWRLLRGSTAELQELIETVVVPETWFFRDREAFSALARLVLDDWSPAHPGRTLRVLSLPCSTGEEPYSVAMALLDAGLSSRLFRIDAVDISARALSLARRALYRRNSFRSAELDFRDRYFEAKEDRYELASAVRKCVHFEQGNLFASKFLAGAAPYDVIFCRNLLIYFDAATQRQVMEVLHRLLENDGILFVGPAEAFLVRASGFVSSRHARAFAYRKTCPRAHHPPVQHPPRPKPVQVPPALGHMAAKPPARQLSKAVKPTPAAEKKPVSRLEQARLLADSGRLAEAAEKCEACLREDGAAADAYYLLGLVRDAMGQESLATACYRKTVYLQENHSEALMHLALLAEKKGDMAAAQRLTRRVQRIEEGASR